jgi:hypothetical protein
MLHGVGFTTGGGGGGGGGVSEDEGGGAGEEVGTEEDTGGGGAVGVSACTAPCAHPATDINATAASNIRIAHPLVIPSSADEDDGGMTEVATRRARLP